MNFGPWNVKGFRNKQIEVLNEISKLKIDIATLTETKKKGNGSELLGDYIHLYSGVNKEKRAKAGVSVLISKKLKNYIKNWEAINERILKVEINLKGFDVVIIAVYAPSNDELVMVKDEHQQELTKILDNLGNRKEVIILGDFNARTGSQYGDVVVGPYGEEIVNDNGLRLIEMCQQYEFKIQNGFYQHKSIHKYTWIQPKRKLQSII